jgi:glycosyltransferase involved in cell wall biosynthesis
MRIALVVHALPPDSSTGVEVYTEALAGALVRAGASVELFAPRPDATRATLAQTREERDGFGITWLSQGPTSPDEDQRRALPGAAPAFARFLEREQPDLVHFQHLLRLGPELIDVARERALPTLFTAHDHFALCNEYTLLAPDLGPLDPGDFEAQARCRLARGVLDQRLAAHDGFLVPADAPADLHAAVQAVLHGEAADPATVRRLAQELRAEIEVRLETLARVDHLEAPTRSLAAELERAGLRRAVQVRPLGIETRSLTGLEPPRIRTTEPLRALYIGGYYEHKGVHVLLEACRGLEQELRLTLRGCAGTGGYLDGLRARAAAVGAQLGGPFERVELARLLERADLVVVPSLWSENAPFVIREAFAAGRAVVASDTPALRESVRHGEDGLLVAPGDVGALRAALLGCARDRGRLAALVAGVRPPRGIDEDACELLELYGELVASAVTARARRRRRLPAHLRPFAERYDELARLPSRELFARARVGLADLCRAAGEAPPPATLLEAHPAAAEGLRERLAEAARAIEWRKTVTEDRERAVLALEEDLRQARAAQRDERERAEWLRGLLEERDEQLLWRAETIEALQRSLASLRAEAQEAERGRDEFERRAAARAEEARELSRERDWLAREGQELARRVEWSEKLLRARQAELEWTRELRADSEAHVAELERRLADREAHVAELERRQDGERAARSALQLALEAERTRLRAREAELAAAQAELSAAARRAQSAAATQVELHAGLAEQAAAYESLQAEREAARAHQAFLEVELAAAAARAALQSQALSHLRAEMRGAVSEGSTLAARLVAARLARRLAQWDALLAVPELRGKEES